MNARQRAPKNLLRRRIRWIAELCAGGYVLLSLPSGAAAAGAEPPAAALPAGESTAAPTRTFRDAVFVEAFVGFSPIFNDVPLMLSIGVRIADIHEVWARAGFFANGWDVGYAIAAVGYRAALRPHRLVRPLVGFLIAGEPATCTGISPTGHPMCSSEPLFYFAANGGLRLEPRPWLGILSTLSIGVDSIGFPFGLIDFGVSFALPQTEPHSRSH